MFNQQIHTIFAQVYNHSMNKQVKNKTDISVFKKILEDKRAIRQCIQRGENAKKIENDRGIKFATPL